MAITSRSSQDGLSVLVLHLSMLSIITGMNQTVASGSTVSFPCEALDGSTYILRSWYRGLFSKYETNSTKLFHQVAGAEPERFPGVRDDITVDSTSFNFTIGSIQKTDRSVFTCYAYGDNWRDPVRYSYVYLYLKPEDVFLDTNVTALTVGILVSALVLVIAGTVIKISMKRKSQSVLSSQNINVVSGEDLLDESDTVHFYKQD